MDKQIINIENVDTTKEPLFFGKGLNLQRYDKQRYKKIYDLFLQHLSFLCRPEEGSLEKERADYEKLTDHKSLFLLRT